MAQPMEAAEIEISDEKLDRFLELVIDLLFEAWKREFVDSDSAPLEGGTGNDHAAGKS